MKIVKTSGLSLLLWGDPVSAFPLGLGKRAQLDLQACFQKFLVESCPPSILLGPFSCRNNKMKNNTSPWPLKREPYHSPVAYLAVCPFSPQVKSHSLRWTFKGPATESSNASGSPWPFSGEESHQPGLLGVIILGRR